MSERAAVHRHSKLQRVQQQEVVCKDDLIEFAWPIHCQPDCRKQPVDVVMFNPDWVVGGTSNLYCEAPKVAGKCNKLICIYLH